MNFMFSIEYFLLFVRVVYVLTFSNLVNIVCHIPTSLQALSTFEYNSTSKAVISIKSVTTLHLTLTGISLHSP